MKSDPQIAGRAVSIANLTAQILEPGSSATGQLFYPTVTYELKGARFDLLFIDPHTYMRSLTFGSDNKLYGGTYPNCRLVPYDPIAAPMADLGHLDPVQEFATRRFCLPDALILGALDPTLWIAGRPQGPHGKISPDDAKQPFNSTPIIPTSSPAPEALTTREYVRLNGAQGKKAAPAITTPSTLPSALAGTAYSETLSASGTGPIVWSISGGSLPAGLALNSSAGIISGTPASAGTVNFTVKATSSFGAASCLFSLTVMAAVSLQPSAVSLQPAESQTFTPKVTGLSSGVTWSLNPTVGSLVSTASTAVYIAPAIASVTRSVTLTATSVDRPSQRATATIQLPQTLTISVSPNSVSLPSSATQQFTAKVSGTSNTAVTWSINPKVGAISSTGVYTAPSRITAPQTITVTAQSSATPAKLAAAIVSLKTPPNSQWSAGYYLPWAQDGSPLLPVTAIQWKGLTHIILCSALVNADGKLNLSDIASVAQPLVTAAHANHVKVLLSLEAVSPTYFNSAIESHLSTFVSNIAAAVNASGFDGVDIDWEPPVAFSRSTSNSADMTALAKALRTALGTKIMTVIAGATEASYYVSVASLFDRLQLATYAQSCTWLGFGWHNSALYFDPAANPNCTYSTLDQAANAYIAAGIPAGKISLGLGFYGLKYTGGILASNPRQGISGPLQIWQTANPPVQTELAYDAIVPMITSSNYHWDSTAMVPYIDHLGTTPSAFWYITYDDPQSITDKVQYGIDRNLGGWFIWWIGGDWMSGNSHPHPLLDAITAGAAPMALTASSLASGTVGTGYYASLSATGAAPMSWTLASGSLPTGLSLNSTGYISGTPTTSGTYTFTLMVSNFAGTTSQQFSIGIAAAGN